MTSHHIPNQGRVAEARNYDPWHLHEPSSQWIDFCHTNGIPWCGVTSPDDEFPYQEDFDTQITNQWALSAQHEKRRKGLIYQPPRYLL